jgi:hypothetical protein
MTVTELLDWHFERYPLLQADDVYKLIHQGVFGPGHLIKSENYARSMLDEEMAEVRLRCCMESLDRTEPLDPDGILVRVNLDPLRGVMNATDLVIPVLMRTAEMIPGGPVVMEERLAEAVIWCRDNLSEQADPLIAIAEETRGKDYPPRHHSKVYQVAYKPAYRVLSAELWKEVQPPMSGDGTCSPPPSDTTD